MPTTNWSASNLTLPREVVSSHIDALDDGLVREAREVACNTEFGTCFTRLDAYLICAGTETPSGQNSEI